MKASQLPLFTLKEDPREAQVDSHRLLLRAGYIRRQASGFYTFLPFGYLVYRKIEQIVREEMDAHGAVEVHLPVLTPAELWRESGRWDIMGEEMMRLKDRHGHEFALGPTHEEAMTALAREFLQSYKQLPINLYQIGTKYRDEIRPRYGLIRCREFVMKDAYSFHLTEESLHETYELMRRAYRRIFERCGLETIAVEADTGNMGGSASEEFIVASSIGEETLLLCPNTDCGFRANQEKTTFVPLIPYEVGQREERAKIPTPNQKTVEEVAAFLKKDRRSFMKAVVYETEDEIILCFIPGDREISETKVKNLSSGKSLRLASEEAIWALCGAPPGYVGPVGLRFGDRESMVISPNDQKKKIAKVLFDENLRGRHGLISGANEGGYHYVGLSYGRDFHFDKGYDLVEAQEHDLCPRCRTSKLKATRGIEVGHIFKLGRKYSEAMGLRVLDEKGLPVVPTMGCYGIGLGRTMQTIVEQNHDERGIVWPESVSPFRYYLISLAKNSEEEQKVLSLYQMLQKRGVSCYFDDRQERAGVKFHDADLTGFPYQIIAGRSFFEKGELEIKVRKTGEKKMALPEEIY
ncbi:MAG: proline--tRNA ligase [Leptospiraceae bacterium]|nr:proline--tRNA ligase [Leptospiraceae bacterium]MDW8306226.1 proline--tRNA ligase [Leptospiraceae bacterium]